MKRENIVKKNGDLFQEISILAFRKRKGECIFF